MKPFRGRVTYANVASTLALVVALSGGAAYAAGQITSSDIKDGAVKNVDLGGSAVTSGKVKDGSLKRTDLGPGARSVSAFATVSGGATPDFVGAHKHVTAVTHIPTGIYCLTLGSGVTAPKSSAVVSPEWRLSGGNHLFAYALSTVESCPAGKLEVHTYVGTTGGVAASESVAFSVLVP